MATGTSILPKIGFGITFCSFCYFAAIVVRNHLALNLVTWVLWMGIHTLLLTALIRAGNRRPWISIGCTLGTLSILLIALGQAASGSGAFAWGGTEIIATLAALTALLVWKYAEADCGIIAITLAVVVAGIPTQRDAWMRPESQDPWFWGLGVVACALAYIGESKTIAGRFMPASFAIANSVTTLLIIRKFF